MRLIPRMSRLVVTLGAALLATTTACEGFLEVKNPNVINSEEIDPVADATTLANSAQQSYSSALGWLIMYGAWFTGEALVAETFPTRNEYGRRDVVAANVSHNTDVWFPLSQATASNAFVVSRSLPNPTTNINYVRSNTWLGYSFLLMAEQFCTGTTRSGPALTRDAMLDSAILHFSEAITIGTANGTSAATTLANVSRVGRARARHARGLNSDAVADASAVPSGFEFRFNHIDDPGNRTRLSNRMWQFTFDRGSISVAPAYQVSDPRVTYLLPGQHALSAQDANAGPFVVQQKYPTYASSIRVASKLEADYIIAEIGGNAAQQAHIAIRRTAAGLPAYSGATDDASVLTEFIRQKHLDFYLEGQRFGDLRRVPAAVANMPVPGATYFKGGFAPIGNQVCYPLPLAETDNNPNIP